MTERLEVVARLRRLVDAGTLKDLEVIDEVATGLGIIDNVPARVFATDPLARGGGALSSTGTRAISRLYRRALEETVPVVGVWHSGGARVDQGVESLDAVGELFTWITRASGRIPQVSLVTGPAAGGAAYGPGLTDIVIMTPEARIFVTGPGVIAEVTGETVTMAELGGPQTHSSLSGVTHIAAESIEDGFDRTKALVSLLGTPGNVAVAAAPGPDPARHLPESSRRVYDVRPIIEDLLDEGTAQELHEEWAPNLVTTLGRWHGRSVGVLANNPQRMAGCLDALSAEKAARFVRMCDAFGLPLVALVDVPGFLPGRQEETGGVVRRGAKLLHAFAACTVPRITVILHKAFGGAYLAMNARSLGASCVLAWPGAEVGVIGAPAAVRLLHRRALETAPPQDRDALEQDLVSRYEAETTHVDNALRLGLVNEVVAPEDTRQTVAAALAASVQTRGCHDNIPL